MAKRKNKKGDTKKPLDEMSTAEMIVRAINVFSDRAVSIEKRRQMMAAIEKILAEPAEPEPDESKPDEPDGA